MISGGRIELFSGLVIALWRIRLPLGHSPKGLREDVTGRDKAALLPQFLANFMNYTSLRKSSPANKYKFSERQDSRHPLMDHPQKSNLWILEATVILALETWRRPSTVEAEAGNGREHSI